MCRLVHPPHARPTLVFALVVLLSSVSTAYRPASPPLRPALANLRQPCPVVACAADTEAKELTTVTDAAAILAGTAIGGGFLALPAVTTPLGFLPSVAALTGVWLFLALAGICYAEATVAVLSDAEATPEEVADDEVARGVSVLSITHRAFGKKRASVVCSFAFAAQMVAVVTAQVRTMENPRASGCHSLDRRPATEQ